MDESLSVSRRGLLTGAGAVALGGSIALSTPGGPAMAVGGPASKGSSRMRPVYHFSVTDNWKNDPQRPIYLDGEYHYY